MNSYNDTCNLIDDILKNNDMSIYYLLDNFCVFIYNYTNEYKKSDFTTLDIMETENMVESFLKEYSPELFYNYLNIRNYDPGRFMSHDTLKTTLEKDKKRLTERILSEKNEGVVRFYEHLLKLDDFYIKNGENSISGNGLVTITLFNDVRDIYHIVHEYTHKIFFQPCKSNEINDSRITDNSPFNKKFLFETPSLSMEFPLSNFLTRNGYEEDARNYMLERFNFIREASLRFHFEMILFHIYSVYHKIDDFLIEKAILETEEPLKSDLLAKGNNFRHLNLTYNADAPYIIGFLIAIQLKDEVQRNPDILCKLGKDIYKENLGKDLSKLGINWLNDIEKKSKNYIDLSLCNKFIDEYNKYLGKNKLR